MDKKFLDRILSSQNVTVAIVGGSIAAGGHMSPGAGSSLHLHAYVHLFVQKVNQIITSSCPKEIKCGQFLTRNMAHGCTHTFHSAVLLDSLVPEGTDVLIWGHTVNDSFYTDQEVLEMMRVWLHMAQLKCPKCVLIFAFTQHSSSWPPNDSNLRKLEDIIATHAQSNGISAHIISLARLAQSQPKLFRRREDYYTDKVHITKEAHEALADLLVSVLYEKPIIKPTIEHSYYPLRLHSLPSMLINATAMSSVTADLPVIKNLGDVLQLPTFQLEMAAHDPARVDLPYYLNFSCPALPHKVLHLPSLASSGGNVVLVGIGTSKILPRPHIL